MTPDETLLDPAAVPSHVPREVVRSLSFYDDPDFCRDPFGTLASLYDGPPVFWNQAPIRHSTGSWVVTREADIRFVLDHPEMFASNNQARFFTLIGEEWQLIPVELDPPVHRGFRTLMNPWLNPATIERLSGAIRDRAAALIDGFAARGHCDFATEFAEPFPVGIFIDLMGLPHADTKLFLGWIQTMVRTTDVEERKAMALALIGYMRERIEERKKAPRDDLISRAIASRVDGRPLKDEEVLSICCLLFLGGLDTVTSTLTFQFHHLATHPDLQARLRADPKLVRPAVEELLRAYSPVITRRHATRDVEIGGVAIKAGDWLSVPYALGSLDPGAFSCPMDVDIDRATPRHFAFGYGIHFCMGMHLARRELAVAIEEWLARIPPFSVSPGTEVFYRGGGVLQLAGLELSWSPA
jgi:cytochrome P450